MHLSPFNSVKTLLTVSLIIVTISGCDIYPDAPADNEILDVPMEALSGEQLDRHLKGDEEFNRRFTIEDGVGPVFVAQSCDKCHPGEGKGHTNFGFQRFGKMENGIFDPLREKGGPQRQDRAVPGYTPEVIPDDATGFTRLIAPTVVGLGLLEAVDDTTLLNMADPDDTDGDGISGRPNMVAPSEFLAPVSSVSDLVDESPDSRFKEYDGRYIGRFGRKASVINLLHQTVTAFHDDMGLTSDFIPDDPTNKLLVGESSPDDVPDPEISSNIVSNVVFYLKTLRPPQRRTPDAPEVKAGENLFEKIGCASCHVPTLKTGKSNITALNQKEFHPYTDLLLHDMGPELDDGYTEGSAKTSEWRTMPLWGLGLSEAFQGEQPFYLHDGRAETLREAIDYHGGEAAASRSNFQNLSDNKQEQVIAFLKSL